MEHYRVKYKDNQLTIDDEEFFENLAQLVEVGIFNTLSSLISCYRLYWNLINLSFMRLEQFQMDEISVKPNFISCLGILQENASNTMQNLHYFTVALSWFNTYGVFKYDYCTLKTLFFGLYSV